MAGLMKSFTDLDHPVTRILVFSVTYTKGKGKGSLFIGY